MSHKTRQGTERNGTKFGGEGGELQLLPFTFFSAAAVVVLLCRVIVLLQSTPPITKLSGSKTQLAHRWLVASNGMDIFWGAGKRACQPDIQCADVERKSCVLWNTGKVSLTPKLAFRGRDDKQDKILELYHLVALGCRIVSRYKTCQPTDIKRERH